MARNPFLDAITSSDQYDDGPSTSAGNNPFLAALEAQRKQREKEDEEKYNAAVLKQETAKAEEQKKKDEQSKESVGEKTGNVLKGVGNFIKDAAVDVKDTAVGAYQGIGDVARGEFARQDLEKNTEKVNARNKEWSKRFGQASDEQWKDPEFVKQAQAFSAETKKVINGVSDNTKEDLKKAQEVDATKVAFQSAETFLNVATLGVGTPLKAGGKAAVKQGGKVLLKQAFKDAVKVGGTEAVEQIIKAGGEQALKKAATEMLETGAEQVVKSGARKLAGNIAKDATIGAAYGITQTGKNADENTGIDDYLLNVAFGAGIGGAIPIAGAGIKKGFQAVKGSATAKVAQKGAQEVAEKTAASGKDDLNKFINNAIEEQSDKYGTTALGRVKNWVGDQIDPLRSAAKLDDIYAKAKGIKRNKLNSENSLEDLLRRSAASEREAAGLFEKKLQSGSSASDLVKKYKGDSDIGKEFNNYGNLKFLKEIREKNPNYQLPQGLDDESIARFIDDYEVRNPDALKDIGIKKEVNDLAVDYMADSGAITKAEAEQIKKSYKFAVPLEKVFPDDLARPQVTGKNIGSIAKQTVIQRLEQGSEVPLSNSFDTMLNRVYKAVSQGNKAKVGQELLNRAEAGLVPGAKLTVTAGNKEARQVLREQAQTVTKGVRYLQDKVKISNRQIRKIESELNKLEKEGLNIRLKGPGTEALPEFTPGGFGGDLPTSQAGKVTTDFVNTVKGNVKEPSKMISRLSKRRDALLRDAEELAPSRAPQEGEKLIAANPEKAADLRTKAQALQKEIEKIQKGPAKAVDAATTPSKVGRSDTRKFFRNLIESDPKQLEAVRRKVATREPKLAGKIDEVINYKQKIDSLKAAKTDLKEVTAEFLDDPTTGKQLVSGIVDGQGFKLEIPPDLAKAIMGLDQQKLPSVLKALAIAKKPFEVTWTGVLNPVFSAMSFAFYDTPMSVINSPQGFRTLGPKAVKESIKSIWSGSDFQKALAKEGARPYGGSGASSFIKPDAKSIAATRNLLQNVKYTSTHPEAALSKLDIWGGKLANSTRTRVARAAYDDAIRIAKREAKEAGVVFNKADPALQKRAMENAALAYRTIMPDFDTMSNLTRQINSVVPFYAASVAGTRSFGKALRRAPAETAAKALALGIVPTIGVTAYSLASPQGQAFYDEMERTNPRLLDDNMVVVLPGAHKDDETGEWKGIVKVPLAPEFRAINQTVWRETRAAIGKGDGPSMSHAAFSLFDAVTGGVRTSQNPLIDTVKILAGEDPRSGERLVKGDMGDLPKNEQYYSTTSNAGKWLAERMGTSPIQADKFISQFGVAGATVKTGSPTEAIAGNVENRFTGAYGESATRAFYDTYSPIRAKRDKISKEVTSLVKQGKRNEAARKAEEFNSTLSGSFSTFAKEYSDSPAYNPDWDEMLSSLFIRTGERNFDARSKN